MSCRPLYINFFHSVNFSQWLNYLVLMINWFHLVSISNSLQPSENGLTKMISRIHFAYINTLDIIKNSTKKMKIFDVLIRIQRFNIEFNFCCYIKILILEKRRYKYYIYIYSWIYIFGFKRNNVLLQVKSLLCWGKMKPQA